MYEQNSSIKFLKFFQHCKISGNLSLCFICGLIVVGVGFSFMMNKDVLIIQIQTK